MEQSILVPTMRTPLPFRTSVLLLGILLPLLLPAQWTALQVPTSANLRDVYFLSRELGWVVGDSGTILKTTNGGMSWSIQTPPQPTHLVSVAFMNADTGYIATDFSSLIRTFDGGNTWTQDTLLYSTGCWGRRLRFHDRRIFLAADGCFGGTALSSYDFATGDTADRFFYLPDTNSFIPPQFHDIGFPGGNTVVAMGDNDLKARSSDNGETWTATRSMDSVPDWIALDFDPAGIGHAINTDLFLPLYRSTDAGLSWVQDSTWMPTFFYPTATDIDYPSANFGIVTASVQWAAGLVIELTANGNLFNYLQLPQIPRAVSMADDSVGYLVGDSGLVYKRMGGPLALSDPGLDAQWTLYPNPSQGGFQLDWTGNGEAQLELMGLDGRVLLRETISSGTHSFGATGLAKGMYVVRLSTKSGVHSKRWVLD
jgi:photosystem II stability/assembly factor-like uncharacterized protein